MSTDFWLGLIFFTIRFRATSAIDCGEDMFGIDTLCYKAFPQSVGIEEARRKCRADGGLVPSPPFFDKLKNTVPPKGLASFLKTCFWMEKNNIDVETYPSKCNPNLLSFMRFLCLTTERTGNLFKCEIICHSDGKWQGDYIECPKKASIICEYNEPRPVPDSTATIVTTEQLDEQSTSEHSEITTSWTTEKQTERSTSEHAEITTSWTTEKQTEKPKFPTRRRRRRPRRAEKISLTRKLLTGSMITREPLFINKAAALTMCSRLCFKFGGCQMFDFNTVTGACRGFPEQKLLSLADNHNYEIWITEEK